MSVLAAAAEAGRGDVWLLVGIALALVVVAAGFFFLEVLIPSFGLIGIFGICCVAGALLIAFSVGNGMGFAFIAGLAVLLPATVVVAVKVLRRTSLVLHAEHGGAAGDSHPAAGPRDGLAPGMRGVAVTLLRPAGSVLFDGRKVSVVTMGEMVEPNEQVEVVRVEGTRTVVRAYRATGKDEPS